MPIFVEHMPVSLTAQAAGNVGANRNAAQSWQEQVQAQQLARQQQEMQLRLQQEQDRSAQQDFRNSLDLAQYNRQMGQGQALNDYRTNSLAGRNQHGLDVVGERKAARLQRLDELQRKIDAGYGSREDQYEIDALKQQQHMEDQTTLQGNRFGNQTQLQQNSFDQQNSRDMNRYGHLDAIRNARLDLEKARQGDLNAHRTLQNHMRVLSLADRDINDQMAEASKMAQSYLPATAQQGKTLLLDLQSRQRDIQSTLRDITNTPMPNSHGLNPPQQVQPQGQPDTGEYPGPTGSSMPQGVQGSEAGYYIGQVIDTPKGKAIVTGLTNPNDPDVRLSQ